MPTTNNRAVVGQVALVAFKLLTAIVVGVVMVIAALIAHERRRIW